MKFPSKVVHFAESTFAYFAPILTALEGKQFTPLSLYTKLPAYRRPDLPEYIDALTCLFALHKIELDGNLGVLRRVN